MKKLFTFAFALFSVVAAFAQAPADWEVGENVAAKLGLGDVDGTSFSGATSPSTDNNRPHDLVMETLGNYWKVDGDKPNEFREPTDDCMGIYGFYDKKEANMYQIVKFPAGAYTIDVQALYREGTPADNFTNHFNKKYMKYGHLYADVLASEDPSSNVSRTFDKILCSLATADQHEELYNAGDGSWMNDYRYEYKDKETGEITPYYCPQCLTGLGRYFALDKYHNTMKIVLTEDSYIRLGFRKTGYIQADWLVFTNLQVIYDGPADEAAKIELAKEEVTVAIDNLSDIYNDVLNAGFEGLAGAISDMIMTYEDARDTGSTPEEVVAVLPLINASIDNYSNSLQFVKNLADLLSQSEEMLVSTSFPGLDDFKAAYDAANAAAKTDDVEALGDNPGDYYRKVYNELSKARADYLNTGEADENGAKDFTSLVKNPWFVNPEYNPSYNPDNNTWTLSEETWGWGSVGNPNSYANAKNGRTDISSDVVLAPSDDVTNQWFKYNNYTGWSSGLALYYQGGLIGVSDGWNSLATGTIEIRQQLVGLPSGYYSLKALVRGNNGDVAWDGKSREIFAQNSNGEVVVSETVKNDGDRGWSNGWYEWNPAAWAEVKTSIISALDGKLLIGGRTSKVANFTGFRLMYYGGAVDFSGLMQEDMDKVTADIPSLVFAGDRKKAEELLAAIQLPIPDAEAYEVALAQLVEARNYVANARNAQGSYKAADVILGLADYEFVAPAIEYISGVTEDVTVTYEVIEELNENANVYNTYCGIYDKAIALSNPSLNAIIESQVNALKKARKTSDELGAFLDALALPYNTAVIAAAAGDAEPSEANPVNITSLLMNPDLKQGPKAGWDCDVADPSNNSYGRHLAECWNQNPLTISQTLRSLPAGTYEFRVRALYRDGGSVTQDMIDNFNAANGDYEAWNNHNALIFANDATDYIKSVCDGQWTERSFDAWYNAGGDAANDFIEAGFVKQSYNSNLCVLVEEYSHLEDWGIDTTDADLMGAVRLITPDMSADEQGEGIFDTQVGDNFYPCSTAGFMYRIQKSPEAYNNKVRVEVEHCGDLTVGLKKTAKIDSDWLIYDDFELYYLGGEVTAITDVNANSSDAQAIYNVAGQRMNTLQKGINIVGGKKVLVK